MLSRALAALAALSALSACAAPQPTGAALTQPGPVGVVATTDVYGSIAAAVGGEHVSVRSLISNPDADPHEYESTPADAAAVGAAKVLIENGGGYDDFAGKLVTASGGRPAVLNATELSGLAGGPDFNEHFFYHLPTVVKLVDALAGSLSQADPAHAADYRANAVTLHGRLAQLAGRLAAIKAAHPGTRVAVTEPAPLYLTEQAGLTNTAPAELTKAVEADTDPPATVLQRALAQLTGPDKVAALLVNTQAETAATKQLRAAAEANGVPVVPVTETLAGAPDYVSWLGGEIDRLAAAVGDRR